MSNPLDPFGWFKASTESLGKIAPTASPWIDRWLDATTWWADADNWSRLVSDPVQPLELILVELADGITRQFSGRRVRLRRGPAESHVVIGSLRVERTAGAATVTKVRARADVLDVEVDGYRLESVDILANEVTLVPRVPARLVARDIELTVKVPTAELIRWVQANDSSPWHLSVDASGYLEARRPGWRAGVLVEPSIHRGRVRFDLRGATLDRRPSGDDAAELNPRRARLPSWLSIGHDVEVPLPEGRALHGGWWDGDTVTLLFHLDEHAEDLDLRRLRSSVRRDDAEFTFDA